MHDPFPLHPPRFLIKAANPLASIFNLPTLPLHIHELLLATLSYHVIGVFISPPLSRALFPRIYPNLPKRSRLNWDVHVVSLVQSIFVCAAALWVIFKDDERRAMDWKERVWGYTGSAGMIQALAAGYFLWDLQICIRYIKVFGWGMLMHAIAALVVFCLGFVSFAAAQTMAVLGWTVQYLQLTFVYLQRPFVNYYGPTFILYELSSPFLNFHWFFDKLQMTGSRPQWYNGILLLSSFFCCRLLWGTYQSLRVYQDCWAGIHVKNTIPVPSTSFPATLNSSDIMTNGTMVSHPTGIPALLHTRDVEDLMFFNPSPEPIPTWLALVYLGSNIVLNTLNVYWFGKMVETVRKRFKPKPTVEGKDEKEEIVGAVVEGVPLDGGADEVDGQVGETTAIDMGEARRRKE
ncbi:MAG: hypothetical protein Q9190_000468 [Brigantiaea leucoxantha]